MKTFVSDSVNSFGMSLWGKSIILSSELPNEKNPQLIYYWFFSVSPRSFKLKYR